MSAKVYPPSEYLNECFSYEPQTGDLTWKHRPRHHFRTQRGFNIFNSQMAGQVAGAKHFMNGRPHAIIVGITVGMDRSVLYAHKIIYVLAGMAIPEGYEIDHRDVNPWNNRWSNLRLATHRQNNQNQKRHSDRKTDLPKGVYWRSDGKAFVSNIKSGEATLHLGSFPTVELARSAYIAKAIELRGEFACLA